MTRHVQHGDDLNALVVRIGDDRIHFALCEIAGIAVERDIAVRNIGFDGIAGHCSLGEGQRHIIQQETATAIAKGKLKLIIAIVSHSINQLFDVFNREVLSAAIQMHDSVRHRCRSLHLDGLGSFEELLGVQFACQVPPVGQSRNGQNADHQDKHEQQGKNSGQILFHGMLSLLTLMCWLVSKQ